MPGHTCPYGVKAKWLLERNGYTVEDHPLRSKAETEAFKAKHGVATTPQAFIGGKRIGGYDDLRVLFGNPLPAPGSISYRPVVALFGMAAVMAAALSQMMFGGALMIATAETFIAISMCLLAMLKLQDVEKFSSMFLNYDLLAKRWVPYAYLYPFLEGLAGVLMLGHIATWLSVPIAFTIGSIGAISVFKAVYVEKRELKCACVGGSSNVPLGFVSLTENVMMVAMALWMGRALL
ncbi:MAG: MauE/DoxX family redox-associated membrane protein [Sphingomicrobium sp.]